MANSERKFETFTTELDGVMTEFKVTEPNLAQQREAMKVRNRTFYDAVNSGAFLKAQLDDILRERNLWNDAKQAEYAVLEKKISDSKDRLDRGNFKLSEAKELALNMSQWRSELMEMKMVESQLANETAEGQADNASFNYLVSTCVVYNTNDKMDQPVFRGLDDYLNRSTSELALKAARCLAALTYGVRTDIEKELPENEFLLEYGFVNDDLRLIDKNGKLINIDGEPVDDDGFVVKEEEKVERKPFLDDDGNEVVKSKMVDEEIVEEVVEEVTEEVTEEVIEEAVDGE